jgi:hypothetical protein
MRFTHEARGPGKQFLAAVHPSRALPEAGGVLLSADDNAAVVRDAVGAAGSSSDGAAEIDHACRFFPSKRACELYWMPTTGTSPLAALVQTP